jgi:hypothetical protein
MKTLITYITDHVKNWNTTGKIKAAFIAVYFLLNLFMPFVTPSQNVFTLFVPLLFGSISIPLIVKFFETFQGREIIKPTWNDNPLVLTQPLRFFHFASYFLIAPGFSMALATGLKFHSLNFVGLMAVSFGLGILIGIELTLKWKNKADSN